MPTNKYIEARALMNRALEAPNGIKIEFRSEDDRKRMQNNCQSIKGQERRESRSMYAYGDPAYGRSPWDDLSLQVDPDNPAILHILPVDDAGELLGIKIEER